MSAPSSGTLMEENRMLQAELNRLEDLLSQSRAERDEIGIKYNAVSERVSHSINTLRAVSWIWLFGMGLGAELQNWYMYMI